MTFYDVVFASEGSGQDDLLAAACSNGQIRCAVHAVRCACFNTGLHWTCVQHV